MEATPFGTGVRAFSETRVSLWRLDPWMILACAGLIAYSVVVLNVATENDVPGSPHYFMVRQLIYGVVGLALMVLVSRIDYSRFKEYKIGLYTAMIAAIVIVLAIGGATRGSRRWIDLPFFNFQPSELGKVLLVLALSGFMLDRMRRLSQPSTTFRIMLLALAPALLVLVQPDIGTAMVYVVIALSILFMAGTKWSHFAVMAAVTAVAAVLTFVALPQVGMSPLKQYQKERLTAFLHPSEESDSSAYQQNQSIIALGSGRQTGRGAEQATQTRLDFLPEHHTDFMFAVVGESYGFVGVAIVLCLYAMLIWRGLLTVTVARNMYGVLVAAGVVSMLMFQVFVNVGMNVGIMPITGIPLPLVSYGGSSVIVTFIAIGLLQSIYTHSRRLPMPALGHKEALS